MFSVGQILLPIIVLVIGLFLLFRLRFFSSKDISGGYLFLSGLTVLFVSLAWHWITLISGYENWFVQSAYTIIDWTLFGLACLGLFLLTIGLALFADYWQIKGDELNSREGKQSLMENLQKDARQPYHLVELLNISIKEILYHSEATAGAVFLINRHRRQLVLTSSVGFTKQETAGLEHYPLGRNLISQSIELAEPMIAGEFKMIDSDSRDIPTRYSSTMVVPLISGMDKIGAIVLTSVEPIAFARVDVSFLTPVAEWLAEKIKSARLTRELSLSEAKLKSETDRLTDLGNRLREAIICMSGKDGIKSFCSVLTGLAGSESVHLYSISQGQLEILGGSEPLFDLPENYKAALVETLNKNKTLIVNQEADDDSGSPRIVQSSLICPVGTADDGMALLFRKQNGAIRADDELLKLIDMFGKMAHLLAGRTASDRMAITRRLGFDRILELVRMEPAQAGQTAADILTREMANALPKKARAISLNPTKTGNYIVKTIDNDYAEENQRPEISLSETPFDEMIISKVCRFVSGKQNISAFVDQFDAIHKGFFARLIGERGRPDFIAACPVGSVGVDLSIGLFIFWDIPEGETGEWERLLTLASGLVSLRLTIDRIQKLSRAEYPVLGEGTNDLNNVLSAILGRAELAAGDSSLSDGTREHLKIVISETQRAAEMIDQIALNTSKDSVINEPAKITLDQIITTTLADQKISGSLHMIGGRPRDLDLSLEDKKIVIPQNSEIGKLFEAAINRFTITAADEDIITISTYVRDAFLYLDISRHGKNFPAVRPVAGFSSYVNAREAVRRRPTDLYLKHLDSARGEYAIDNDSQTPAYLSFKFPVNKETGSLIDSSIENSSGFRILAIDDEAVILDLIQAMCQSQGWQVVTAESGEEGLALIEKSKFDLVLTDLAMPGMSGLDVARRIGLEWPETPIILVTGWEAELNSAPIKAAGISEILFKPFRIEQLTEVIQATATRS